MTVGLLARKILPKVHLKVISLSLLVSRNLVHMEFHKLLHLLKCNCQCFLLFTFQRICVSSSPLWHFLLACSPDFFSRPFSNARFSLVSPSIFLEHAHMQTVHFACQGLVDAIDQNNFIYTSCIWQAAEFMSQCIMPEQNELFYFNVSFAQFSSIWSHPTFVYPFLLTGGLGVCGNEGS